MGPVKPKLVLVSFTIMVRSPSPILRSLATQHWLAPAFSIMAALLHLAIAWSSATGHLTAVAMAGASTMSVVARLRLLTARSLTTQQATGVVSITVTVMVITFTMT